MAFDINKGYNQTPNVHFYNVWYAYRILLKQKDFHLRKCLSPSHVSTHFLADLDHWKNYGGLQYLLYCPGKGFRCHSLPTRLYKESRNFTLIRGTVLWILDIPKVLFKKPSLIHPVVRYSCWKDWKAESSSIIEECFARVNKRLAYMSFNIKVQKPISIIMAHKHCHQTPDV